MLLIELNRPLVQPPLLGFELPHFSLGTKQALSSAAAVRVRAAAFQPTKVLYEESPMPSTAELAIAEQAYVESYFERKSRNNSSDSTGTTIWGGVFKTLTAVVADTAQVNLDGKKKIRDVHHVKYVKISKKFVLLRSGYTSVSRSCVGIVLNYAKSQRMSGGLPVTVPGMVKALRTDADFTRLRKKAAINVEGLEEKSFKAILLIVELGVRVTQVSVACDDIGLIHDISLGTGTGYLYAEDHLSPRHLPYDSNFEEVMEAVRKGFCLAAEYDESSGGEARIFIFFRDRLSDITTEPLVRVIPLPNYRQARLPDHATCSDSGKAPLQQ